MKKILPLLPINNLLLKQRTNMAMSIKMVPVLMGQSAVDFVSAADANSKNLPPELSPEREEQIHNILEKSKNFTF